MTTTRPPLNLAASKQLSREQLEAANADLQRKIVEAQAARERAVASEGLARRATDEATTAKHELEQALAAKRAEIQHLEGKLREIYNGSLSRPKDDK